MDSNRVKELALFMVTLRMIEAPLSDVAEIRRQSGQLAKKLNKLGADTTVDELTDMGIEIASKAFQMAVDQNKKKEEKDD